MPINTHCKNPVRSTDQANNEYIESIRKSRGLPSRSQMASNFAKNVAAITRSGVSLCSEEEHDKRFSLCKSCEYLSEKERCMKCGCFMKIKTKFAAMKCPIGKWDRIK